MGPVFSYTLHFCHRKFVVPVHYDHAVAQTDRLALCPVVMEDAAAFEAVFCDRQVMQYSKGIKTSEWVQNWIAHIIAELYPAWSFGLWAIHFKATDQVIGYCGLTRFEDRCGPEEVEIAYRLARAYWGQGYATEAAICASDYGLQKLGLEKIVAIIDPDNKASILVAENIGMQFQRQVVLEGGSLIEHLFELLPSTKECIRP